MSIYLPDNPSLLRQACNVTFDRILSSKQDSIFYTLLLQFIVTLRKNIPLKDYILQLETDQEKQIQEWSPDELKTLEDTWLNLWKYPCHTLKDHRRLVRIKSSRHSPSQSSDGGRHVKN